MLQHLDKISNAHLKLLRHEVEVEELEWEPDFPVCDQNRPHVLLQLGNHLISLALQHHTLISLAAAGTE